MATKKKLLQAAAGQAGGAGLNVEEVFSTYLYTGTEASSQTITNNIDLSGEGGLVWVKARDSAINHVLMDTEQGVGKFLNSNQNYAQQTNSEGIKSFNTDGFTFGTQTGVGWSNDHVYWTFRKAPKFFTVVTYTGDGTSNRQISHDLGGTVGHIAVKRTDASAEFFNWHRTFSDNQLVAFTGTYAVGTYSNYLVTADSTTFTVGNNVDVNANGGTYVAYLWGHNDGDGEFGPDGDQDIIKCGSYTGNGSSTGPSINLGFEPQWILTKRTDSTSQWTLVDNMRGMPVGGSDVRLYPNLTNADDPFAFVDVTPTGFNVATSASAYNASGGTYIYIAIRRGPMAVPESATEVFDVSQIASSGSDPVFVSGFPTDFALWREATSADTWRAVDRLRGNRYLTTNGTNAENADTDQTWDYMDGHYQFYLSANYYSWMWKRAPNFCDVVAYEGNSTAGRTVSHNLGVAPEMMWVRPRSFADHWNVYHTANGNTKYMRLNTTDTPFTNTNIWNSTTPDASSFTLGSDFGVNGSGYPYIAYLFATLAGVSKVGSYSGNGSTQTIDCGFSAGARFVLIKRTNGTGGWYLFDTERGIVSGNDPYLELNDTGSQNSTTDYIDPDNSGFALTQNGLINAGSGEYIFYAIA